MRPSVVLALALFCVPSCSILFSDSTSKDLDGGLSDGDGGGGDAGPDGGLQECEGRARSYPRGAAIARNPSGRYEHIDYAQGTLSFWVRDLGPGTTGETLLVDLAGIRALALSTGIRIVVQQEGADPISEDFDFDWGTEDHSIAVRWDALKPVPGGGGNRHLSVGIDDKVEEFRGDDYSFHAGDSVDFTIGDPTGSFHVDQLVIYDRALFVDQDTAIVSDLRLMGAAKGESTQLAEGGYGVLFATMAPALSGCDDYTAEAWAFPADEILRDIQLGDRGGWWPGVSDPGSSVYPGGGFGLSAGSHSALLLADSVADKSYAVVTTMHRLVDTLGNGKVRVYESENAEIPLSEATVSSEQVSAGSLRQPALSVQTFRVGSANHGLQVDLIPSAGTMTFDSMRMWPSYFEGSGFEDGSIEDWTELGDGLNVDTANSVVHAGIRAACLDAPSTASISQGINLTNSGDGAVYLVGAKISWRGGQQPTLKAGSGLLATGVPGDHQTPATASAFSMGKWTLMATAARRSGDTSDISFGVEGETDFCMDSAYLIKLEHIIGTVIEPVTD